MSNEKTIEFSYYEAETIYHTLREMLVDCDMYEDEINIMKRLEEMLYPEGE